MNTAKPQHVSNRQSAIRDLIRDGSFLTVDALAEHFSVAPQTIRRDINALCDLGLARRRHGGVERPVMGGNLAYTTRQSMNRTAKQAIAAEVARRIPDGASISFGIGTTPALVAEALLEHRGLRIFTNNLSVALIAGANGDFEVHIAGGRVRNSDRDVIGPGADEFFAAYKTDFGVYGVAGVDDEGCLLDFSDEEVRARELIRRNCRHAFLVLDASKFGRPAHVRGGWIHEADSIVCDQEPPAPLAHALAGHDRQLLVCPMQAAS